MQTRLIGFLALALVLLAGPGDAQSLRPEIATRAVTEGPFPKPQPVFPWGVKVLPDLIYGRAAAPHPLLLDLYLPAGSNVTPRPLVVFIHGGDWNSGSRRANGAFVNWPLALASLAARGYVVASIDYRLAAEATFPAQIMDVKDAIRWLRSKAGVYGIDRARVAVWGAEAGGQLAALTAVSCGAAGFERQTNGAPVNTAIGGAATAPSPADESACVQAAVSWSGAYDLLRMADMAAANNYLGCAGAACNPQRRLASPVSYVDKTAPPMLIVHGMTDTFIPVSQAARMNAVMQDAGASAELVLVPDVGQGLIGTDEERTRDASQLAWQRTVDFFARTLLRP